MHLSEITDNFFHVFSATNNSAPALNSNEYRLPTATANEASSNHLPNEIEGRNGKVSLSNREAPPSYWETYKNAAIQLEHQRIQRTRRPSPAPPTRGQLNLVIRSRVEQYRNRISVSDSESDENRERHFRFPSPRRVLNVPKIETLLGEVAKVMTS